jgi:SpoIID/LytB domain protein
MAVPHSPTRRRRRATFAVAAIAAAVAAAPADSATRHIVRGRGYGHGIGMSQYGAYGFALKGLGYEHILSHYYRGTKLSHARTRSIRVLLQGSRRKRVSFEGATRVPGEKRLNPARTYLVTRASGGRIAIRNTREKLVKVVDAPARVVSDGGLLLLGGSALNGVTDGHYRGSLEFQPGGDGGITVVNVADLDAYVQGVVPGEVPASWPGEALKAQAVAARSYALATDAGGSLFDQYPDTRSQVYRGADGEDARSNQAVQSTAREVLHYNGTIAVTYFFSTSGGETENIENVFYGAQPEPYLVGVKDPYDGSSPKHRWRLRFSTSRIDSLLGSLVKGRFRKIKVRERGVSPRIVWADIYGSRGKTRVRGTTLRSRLGLYDTWAFFRKITTSSSRSRARSSWLSRLVRTRALTGVIDPRPGSRLIVVEHRVGRGWRRVRRARTTRSGAYRVTVRSAGLYRVRAGSDAGPAIQVR